MKSFPPACPPCVRRSFKPASASMSNPSQPPEFPRTGVRLGHCRGISFCIGWSYLGIGFVLIAAAWLLKTRPGNEDLPHLAVVVWLAIGIVGIVQEGAHWAMAALLG